MAVTSYNQKPNTTLRQAQWISTHPAQAQEKNE